MCDGRLACPEPRRACLERRRDSAFALRPNSPSHKLFTLSPFFPTHRQCFGVTTLFSMASNWGGGGGVRLLLTRTTVTRAQRLPYAASANSLIFPAFPAPYRNAPQGEEGHGSSVTHVTDANHSASYFRPTLWWSSLTPRRCSAGLQPGAAHTPCARSEPGSQPLRPLWRRDSGEDAVLHSSSAIQGHHAHGRASRHSSRRPKCPLRNRATMRQTCLCRRTFVSPQVLGGWSLAGSRRICEPPPAPRFLRGSGQAVGTITRNAMGRKPCLRQAGRCHTHAERN